jgi:hypothetical protein
MTTKNSRPLNGARITDPSQIAVVVYGKDDTNKPKAGLFKPSQAALAIKAAGLMNLNVLPVETTAQLSAVDKVPPGRLYANGRGFVPYVRRDLYDKVVDLAGSSHAKPRPANTGMTTQKAAGETKGEAPVANVPALPKTWAEVGPGSLVLVQESLEEGWWEAIVISRTDADVLTLRYRDYPKVKPFTEHLATVALVNPSA